VAENKFDGFRSWRPGWTRPIVIDATTNDGQERLLDNLRKKDAQAAEMSAARTRAGVANPSDEGK
jgi:hypothetical protein